MGAGVLLVFGLASSAVLIGSGLHRVATRRYRDRSGTALQGGRAVRAGLLVALVGGIELALTWLLWSACA